jgi:GNAT superfamily N-acetyltransferase
MEVRQADVGEVPRISGMLAKAFANDPIAMWPIGDVPNPSAVLQQTFELIDSPLAELGLLRVIGEAHAAAAWIPPESLAAYLRIEAGSRPAIADLSADGGRRHAVIWDWIEQHIPNEPLWFLDHVGVAPTRQGSGLGRLLVEHGLALARAEGMGAFLETAVARNVPYYRRFGFETVAEGDVPLGGPHVWFMRCAPPDS